MCRDIPRASFSTLIKDNTSESTKYSGRSVQTHVASMKSKHCLVQKFFHDLTKIFWLY